MAAPVEGSFCRLCHGILPKKQRRTIFGATFDVLNQLLEIIDHVPQPNDGKGQHICIFCWNKLNKLGKIENDIKTKLETLKTLIRDLRLKHHQQVSTPKSKKTCDCAFANT
jgi:hypothetical protein